MKPTPHNGPVNRPLSGICAQERPICFVAGPENFMVATARFRSPNEDHADCLSFFNAAFNINESFPRFGEGGSLVGLRRFSVGE